MTKKYPTTFYAEVFPAAFYYVEELFNRGWEFYVRVVSALPPVAGDRITVRCGKSEVTGEVQFVNSLSKTQHSIRAFRKGRRR